MTQVLVRLRGALCAASTVSLLLSTYPGLVDAAKLDESDFKPAIEHYGNGRINWRDNYYEASVSAPLPTEYRGQPVNRAMSEELAQRAAGALADSVFLQLVAKTRVDSQFRVEGIIKDITQIRLIGNIRGKNKQRSKIIASDGANRLQAVYRIPMTGVGGVIEQLIDRVSIPIKSVDAPEGTETPNETADIIIDARGTGLKPALFPRIVDEQGQIIHDTSSVSRDHVVRSGVVEYVTVDSKKPAGARHYFDLGPNRVHSYGFSEYPLQVAAADGDQSGNRPRKRRKRRNVVSAKAAQGVLKADIIIGEDDAKHIRGGSGLGSTRIIVVTDGTVSGTEGRYPNNVRRLAVAF